MSWELVVSHPGERADVHISEEALIRSKSEGIGLDFIESWLECSPQVTEVDISVANKIWSAYYPDQGKKKCTPS